MVAALFVSEAKSTKLTLTFVDLRLHNLLPQERRAIAICLGTVESTVGFNPIRFDSAAFSSAIATWWGFVWSHDKL
jgi:hypothetical protein